MSRVSELIDAYHAALDRVRTEEERARIAQWEREHAAFMAHDFPRREPSTWKWLGTKETKS